MTRARAILLIVVLVLLTGALALVAIRGDKFGTAENLLADVLAASVLTFAIREALVARNRRSFRSGYESAFSDLIESLDKQSNYFVRAKRWSSRRLAASSGESSPGSEALSLRLDSSGVLVAPNLDFLRSEAQELAREYGAHDMSSFVTELEAHQRVVVTKCSEAMDALSRIGLGPYSSASPAEATAFAERTTVANVTLAALERETHAPIKRLEEVKQSLAELYDPPKVSKQRHPEPFAWWALIVAAVLAIVSLGVLISAHWLPEYFPAQFAANAWNNLVCTAIAASAAAVIGVGERFTRSRRTLLLAAQPGRQVLEATQAIIGVVGHEPDAERLEVLEATQRMVRDGVNRLQHVTSDARLDRYADDLLREIAAAVKRPASADVVNASPEQRKLPWVSEGWPIPTPEGSDLVKAASRLNSRVYELFFKGRSL